MSAEPACSSDDGEPTPSPPEADGSPQWIIEDLWAAREAQVVIAGTELDVFSRIDAGQDTAEAVAATIGAPLRGVRRLLDALVGIEYLAKTGDRYVLAPLAERYLVRGKDSYFGDAVNEMKVLWNSWGRLTEVIRTGNPVARWDDEQAARREFPKLVSALFPMSLNSARAVVDELGTGFMAGVERVLDVGAGSGAWSLPFAETSRRIRVTAIDYAEVLDQTRGFIDRYGTAEQYELIAGNLRETDFGCETFDVVTLGYIVQTEGPQRGGHLIRRCGEALRSGGKLVIADMIVDDDHVGPSAALVYALDMVLYTSEGDVFTRTEFNRWLDAAGFSKIEYIEVNAPWPLLVATK